MVEELEDEEASGRRPSIVLKTLKEGAEPLQLIRDASGHQAVVQVCSGIGEDDLSLYYAARQRADAAADAAAKGALRSSMRHPHVDWGNLHEQTRVLKLSLQPKGEADGGEVLSSERTVCLRVVPA